MDTPNPHLWTSPILALKYADLIRDELATLDPNNASYYAANYEKPEGANRRPGQENSRGGRNHTAGKPQAPNLPRLLPFFASRYGMEIVGAVQPSDFTEPSAREVANLIDQIRATKVPAIFGSEVFPSPVMEQIAREGGAQFVDKLRDDDLPGSHGDPRHTYIGLMVSNLEIMAPPLGGSAAALAGFDTSPVFEGDSGANYPE